MKTTRPIAILLPVLCLFLCLTLGCGKKAVGKRMDVTAYCGCSQCCEWERGSWKYLKLNFWNRYVASGPRKGKPYTGLTASGTKPREHQPGLFSMNSVKRPWMIPFRIVFFPWLFLPRDGTVAADTNYYPFGTRLDIPGYGYGRVEDRGRAIKGEHRLDVFYDSHGDALRWGRQKVYVRVLD